jgi:hypothetical protein
MIFINIYDKSIILLISLFFYLLIILLFKSIPLYNNITLILFSIFISIFYINFLYPYLSPSSNLLHSFILFNISYFSRITSNLLLLIKHIIEFLFVSYISKYVFSYSQLLYTYIVRNTFPFSARLMMN